MQFEFIKNHKKKKAEIAQRKNCQKNESQILNDMVGDQRSMDLMIKDMIYECVPKGQAVFNYK